MAAAGLLGLAAIPQAGAQHAPQAMASLQAVEVKGQTVRGASAAYTTTVIEAEDIANAHASHPQELLRQVPGMNVQNYQLSGVGDAIVMRGFGGGGHGGDVGVVLDGIPLNEAMSHADGYVDLGVIVPLEMERIRIYKGPVSALYGNFNRAGLMAIETRKQGDYAPYREADVSLASHGTLDAQAALGLKPGEGEFLNLAAQYYRTDGFRAQSGFERSTAALRWSKRLTPQLEVALSARLHHGEGDSPSYLTAAQFARDRYGVDPRAMNDGTRKDFATLRADVQYALSPQLTWLGHAYTTRQSFTRWFSRPVDALQWRQREESYDRAVYGAGTSLNGRHATALTPLNWVAGLEAVRESTDCQFYDGLQWRERTGAAIDDRNSKLNTLSAFAEVDAPIHRLLQLSAGLRWDRFTGGCRPTGPRRAATPAARWRARRMPAPSWACARRWRRACCCVPVGPRALRWPAISPNTRWAPRGWTPISFARPKWARRSSRWRAWCLTWRPTGCCPRARSAMWRPASMRISVPRAARAWRPAHCGRCAGTWTCNWPGAAPIRA
jgi:outer membrane receptor protein involved in Fe transport